MSVEAENRRDPADAASSWPDPRVAAWVERAGRRTARLDAPVRAGRGRTWWWGTRQGLTLYFYNHIVGHWPAHAVRRLFYRRIMDIGPQTSLLMGLTLYYPGRLIIGRNSIINANCVLDSRAGIYIGNNVSISPYVQIWAGGHDINDPQFNSIGGVTVVEDFAWIGARSMILGAVSGPSITIGAGAVVSAGSVVVRDVAPYTVVAGNPARKIAVRRRDLAYQLDYAPPFR